jgi:hypothetical protein
MWMMKRPMTIQNENEHTGKIIIEGGVIDNNISLIDKSKKIIITGRLF